MTAVATSRGADQLTSVGSLTHGFSAAFLGAAAVAAAGAVVAGRWLRVPRPVGTAVAEAEASDAAAERV
jgi:hypothetical protein